MEKFNLKFSKSVYGGYEFFLPARYSPVDIMGIGSYGAVIEAKDLKYNRSVAIKKIQNIMDEVDMKRILREIMILKYLKHDNIVQIYDVIFVKNSESKKIGDIYLIFEKMDTDLYKIIKSNQELSDDHYKFIMYQILRALLYLHSANIIHRDIKPSNVLINEDCIIKLCDFGLSRDMNQELNLTEYVVTRYYRAPEIMLCSHNYSKSIDIWSAGCTFAELLSKNYLFPGDNYLSQIKLIIELLGTPSAKDLEFITNSNAKNYVMSFKNLKKKPIETIIGSNNIEAIDLLEKMIVFNPFKRIAVSDALQHPYVAGIRDEGVVDPIFEGTLNLGFDYDSETSIEKLLSILIEEIKIFETGLIE